MRKYIFISLLFFAFYSCKVSNHGKTESSYKSTQDSIFISNFFINGSESHDWGIDLFREYNKNGNKEGIFFQIVNDSLFVLGKYHNNIPMDKWKYYKSNGSLYKIVSYFKDGTIKMTVWYKNGKMSNIEYPSFKQ